MKDGKWVNGKKALVLFALLSAFVFAFVGCEKVGEKQSPQANAGTKASITVSCKSALGKEDLLPANKKEVLPKDGVILSLENEEITDGETAFSFLTKACRKKHIEMDYADGMIYVKSIANLGEKDCGAESGWMFKVNGETPSVGANEYKLKDGDKVEFFYITSYAEAF